MKIELRPGIWFIVGRRGGHYPHCNSLLLDSGRRAVIDPGSDKKELCSLGEEGVEAVFLSHSHSDHLRSLSGLPGAAVYVHESERDAVESVAGMERLVFFPEEERDEAWLRRKEREVGGWGWPVSGVFGEGERFQLGDIEMVVLHCPGHTPGHSCFWFPQYKLLYTADIDLTEFGPWYGNACSSVSAFLHSLHRLQQLEPELVVTGHEAGVVREGISVRLEAYGRIIEERHERILDFLTVPSSLRQIALQGFIYGSHLSPDNSLLLPETRMIRHHLAWAMERGEVTEEGGLYRRL